MVSNKWELYTWELYMVSNMVYTTKKTSITRFTYALVQNIPRYSPYYMVV